MSENTSSTYELAVRDFQRARRDAALQQILARLRGKSDALLRYDEVREHIQAGAAVERGLQEIPLNKIVGSVGRYQDFTRSFLPKKDSDQERWTRVKMAVTDMRGLPPIEVYQVGDVYFVKDGNHRVSVARQLGSETISAYVTEVETRVPLTADDDPDEVICKARYADFLNETNLDRLRPGANLLMTFCGQYQPLLGQIKQEYELLKQEVEQASWEQAVANWYDEVYLPIVQMIREFGVMRRFPERTETDIYVFLSERREELEEALGWHIDPETAVAELAYEQARPFLSRFLDSVAPGLEEGPEVGRWRQRQLVLQREHHLFEKILILLEGIPDDEKMLEQVIRLAQKDDDHILGLFVVRDRGATNESQIEAVRHLFEKKCTAADLRHEFAVEFGRFDQAVVKRAAWVDLVVINLTHPPDTNPLARLRPGWGTLIEQCPRPILAIPNAVQSTQDRMLLAYDGSSKAEEALFVATYLALRWQRALVVVTVQTSYTKSHALERARNYLQAHGVNWATYILSEASINEAILETAANFDSNLLIVGGFGRRPTMRLVLGSTVEHLLREFKQPILICR